MSGSSYQDNAFPRYVPSSTDKTIGFLKIVRVSAAVNILGYLQILIISNSKTFSSDVLFSHLLLVILNSG